MHVLVVDDDEPTRALILDYLAEEGDTAESALDGAEALARVQAHPPDVIVLDMRMPVMDGPAFATAYQALPGPHAPLIVITASTSLAHAAAAIHPAHVLQKPFAMPELVSLLRQLVVARIW